jgi:hypothetical protein
MNKKNPALFSLLLLLFSLFACPLPNRPTVVLRVCLASELLAGPYCPAETIVDRKYYVTPIGLEPHAPTEACTIHQAPIPPDPDPDVQVTACRDSNQAPTYWCDGTKTITVKQSALPLAPCALHANPPAKTKYPFYVFIPELLVANGDVDAFCKSMRKAGAWGIRFFLLQSWSTTRLVPWERAIYAGKAVRLFSTVDGVNCPVTDMTKPNAEYWSRLAGILAILKKNDLEAIASLGDNCSMNPRIQKLSYPFLASFQTMSQEEVWPYLDPAGAAAVCTPSPGGLYGPAKTGLYQAWVRAAVEALKNSGCRFRVEIQNEFSRLGWEDGKPEPRNWYAMMTAAVQAAGVAGEKIVHSGDQTIALAFPGFYALHQIEQPGTYETSCPPARLMLSGDGAYSGKFKGRSETDIDVLGHRGLAVADAIAIAILIRERGIAGGYEWMPKRAWRFDDCQANVDGIPTEIPRAMRDEWAKPEVIRIPGPDQDAPADPAENAPPAFLRAA